MNYFDVSQPFSNEDIQTLLSIEFGAIIIYSNDDNIVMLLTIIVLLFVVTEQEIFDFAFGVDEAQVSSDLVQSHVKEIDM